MGNCVSGEEAGAGERAAEAEYGEYGGFDVFIWVWGGVGRGVDGGWGCVMGWDEKRGIPC